MKPRVRSTSLLLSVLIASACVMDAQGELGRTSQALVPGVAYVSPGDHYAHTDSDPANNGASGSPQCDRGTDVDYWHNGEPGTDGCHVGWTQPGEVMKYGLGPVVP